MKCFHMCVLDCRHVLWLSTCTGYSRHSSLCMKDTLHVFGRFKGLYSAWHNIIFTSLERLFIFLHLNTKIIIIFGKSRYGHYKKKKKKEEGKQLSVNSGTLCGIHIPRPILPLQVHVYDVASMWCLLSLIFELGL